MSDPALLLETPRAGVENHRFFVSSDALTSRQAAVIIGAARSSPPVNGESVISHCQGVNYFAVQRPVVQPGSQRLASEMLVLTGVDAHNLSEAQIAQLFQCLEARLLEVEDLLYEENWEHPGQIVIRHPRMMEWMRSDFRALPPYRGSRRHPLWFQVILYLGWTLFVVLLVSAFCLPGKEAELSPKLEKGDRLPGIGNGSFESPPDSP